VAAEEEEESSQFNAIAYEETADATQQQNHGSSNSIIGAPSLAIETTEIQR
jgi:hypothetical protein